MAHDHCRPDLTNHLLPAETRLPDATSLHVSVFAQIGTMLDRVEEANQAWIDRVTMETRLVSDFRSRLTSAEAPPDVVTACQNWAARQAEVMAEDAEAFMAAPLQFMEIGAMLASLHNAGK